VNKEKNFDNIKMRGTTVNIYMYLFIYLFVPVVPKMFKIIEIILTIFWGNKTYR